MDDERAVPAGRAGCSSILIRRKSSTDDEYHHEDVLGVFGVITGASGAVLSSNVYDAFMEMRYAQSVSKTTQPATCYKAMSEPGILTGSGGRGVVVPSRGFQVMGNKPAPVKKQAWKKSAKLTPAQCLDLYGWCIKDAASKEQECLQGLGIIEATIIGACRYACTAALAPESVMTIGCAFCLGAGDAIGVVGLITCWLNGALDRMHGRQKPTNCLAKGQWWFQNGVAIS